jgi:hypothetical protein
MNIEEDGDELFGIWRRIENAQGILGWGIVSLLR